MADHLRSARDAVQRASDLTENATVRKQLHSIDEGLMEMTEPGDLPDDEPKTRGAVPHEDDLAQVEHRLADLASNVEGMAQRHVEAARDAIEAYRQEHTLQEGQG